MPQPERRGGAPTPERALPAYHQAAHFPGEEPAGAAYQKAQETIFANEGCELSTYRFHMDRVWHVAVLGDPPPQQLDATLREILAAGEPAALPPEVLQQLNDRRLQAIKQAPWVERHYRPGRRPRPGG